MAKYVLRERAIGLRLAGASYSQIRESIPVSKSTLSLWLAEYPLSMARIQQLQGDSEQRIERCKRTKRVKREIRIESMRNQTAKRVGMVSQRELFLAGLLLYWAEGTKAVQGAIQMTNTDPAMLRLFVAWLKAEGVSEDKFRVRLQLYSDMNISKEIAFWSKGINVPVDSFRKSYIKKSVTNKRKNYKGRFGHGTCNLIVNDARIHEQILAGIESLRDMY